MNSIFRHKFIFLSIMIISFLLVDVNTANSANNWYQGSGTAPLQGTTLINDIDTASQNYAFDPLNRLLHNYRKGVDLQYLTAATITATAGEIVVTDAAGTIKLMLRNAADTTITWSDIDTGSEAASTTYYVYAVGASTSATAITFKISASSSAPTGVTYYKKLGSFYNDASSNISYISNTGIKAFQTPSSKTVGVSYQATTDGIVTAYGQANIDSSIEFSCKTDSASTPTTVVAAGSFNTDNGGSKQYDSRFGGCTFPVKAGDYYLVSSSAYVGSAASTTMYFTPLN